MVHTQKMQDPVHNQQRDFISERTSVSRSIALRHQRTNHHITQKQWEIFWIVFYAVRSRSTCIRPATGNVRFTINRKRQNVGGAIGFHEPQIEIANRFLVDKHHRQFRFTFNAFIGKNSKCKLLPTFDINRDRCLFIRNKDSDNTFGRAASFQSTTTGRLVQRFGAFSYAVTMS
ncbi:unannotated protein [freshwater metagenome]|uniref:Unannotated protein n=1 Tax=freshwater metagenome TaxID=449393 RepID=A0A6J7LGS1_9ZZZZ